MITAQFQLDALKKLMQYMQYMQNIKKCIQYAIHSEYEKLQYMSEVKLPRVQAAAAAAAAAQEASPSTSSSLWQPCAGRWMMDPDGGTLTSGYLPGHNARSSRM